MDVRQFRYFITTAEEGHLGRAADRLHLSQPALSRQIQLMEECLGAPLFTRTPRGVVLTQVGDTLLKDARNVKQLFDQAIERARRAGQGELGSLDIGAFGTALFDYVPRLMARLGRQHPDLELALQHARVEQLITALRQGRMHIAFERRVLDEPDIATEVVFSEPAVLVVNECNPLARQSSVELTALSQEPLIGGIEVGRSRGTWEFCREHGFQPNIVREVADTTTGTLMVASGIGSAISPRSMMNLRLPGVTYRPLITRTDANFDLYCYYMKGEQPPVLAIALETVRAMRGDCPQGQCVAETEAVRE